MSKSIYKGWNFIEKKWEDIDKATYDTLLDPARCIVPLHLSVQEEEQENEAIKILSELVAVKRILEEHGKNTDYVLRQPKAWEDAKQFIDNLKK